MEKLAVADSETSLHSKKANHVCDMHHMCMRKAHYNIKFCIEA